MLLADYLDYDPQSVYDQGSSNQCTAFTFFTVLEEFIQQKYEEKVEFPFSDYFFQMEEWRKHNKTPSGKKYRRGGAFIQMAKLNGWRTVDGRLVKISGSRGFLDTSNHDEVCRMMQRHGPCLFSVRRYKEHKLNPDQEIIDEVPEEATLLNSTHMMALRGFDRVAGLYKYHNSWGKGSVKWMTYETFEKICFYVYSIHRVYFDNE